MEPNLEDSIKYDLTDYENVNADIIAYLVAHKEFKRFNLNGIKLDFCGVTN